MTGHCPRCGSKYQGNPEACVDCEGPLREGPAPSPRPTDAGDDDGDETLVAVFRTPDLSLLAVVKSALTGAEIPFLVQGEEGLHQLPLGPFGFGFFRRVMGAVIRVPTGRAEEAKAFLASFETDPPRMGDE